MLINATRPTEVRAAILDNGKLDQLEIETQGSQLIKGNVYLGRVANVEASLNACFVEFGAEKQGFLPVDEIHPSCFHKKPRGEGKPRIEEVMQKGREILVQVVKDTIGNKGAALTSRISLAGRYIVLMPLDEVRGVSRKISSDSQRKALKEIAASLKVPKEYGYIVRTAGMDRTKTDLNRDAAQLVRAWKEILKNSKKAKASQLLYEDRDLVVRMLRDYYASDINQVIIDTAEAFRKAEEYFSVVMPRSASVLSHYVNRVPLFTRYQVEQQVEQIFGRRADLPSGGYILIDPTEALISIDVNSGRSTKQKTQEDTALHTNLEAAREVARQLRLRDLGGLIVIDFIDMPAKKSNRAVEKALRDGLKRDKARTYVSKISDNGLLELNRQRLKQALTLRTHRDCPTCEARGIIPSPEFVAHRLLRSIEAKASNGTFHKVVVTLHPELADQLQNNHRRDIVAIENRFGVLIAIEGSAAATRAEEDLRYIGLGGLSETERHLVEELRDVMPTEEETPLVVRASSLPPTDGTELEDTPPEAEPAGEEEEEPKKRKRRRRRRKRKSDEGEENTAEGTTDGEPTDEGEDSEASAPPAEGEETEEDAVDRPRRRRRRRRRGRGRGRSEGEENTEAQEGERTEDGEAPAEGEAPADGEAPAEGEPSAQEGEDGEPTSDEDELSRSQKRRLRRKRSRDRDDEDAPAGDDRVTDEFPAVAAAADDEDLVVELGDGEDEDEELEAQPEPADAVELSALAEPEPDRAPPGVSLVAPPADGLFGDLTPKS